MGGESARWLAQFGQLSPNLESFQLCIIRNLILFKWNSAWVDHWLRQVRLWLLGSDKSLLLLLGLLLGLLLIICAHQFFLGLLLGLHAGLALFLPASLLLGQLRLLLLLLDLLLGRLSLVLLLLDSIGDLGEEFTQTSGFYLHGAYGGRASADSAFAVVVFGGGAAAAGGGPGAGGGAFSAAAADSWWLW